jgi:hypothetical protein
VEALINKLGGLENLHAVLRGDKEVLLKDVILKLVDKHGRLIPSPKTKNRVCDPDKSFKLEQPRIDYSYRLDRLIWGFTVGEFLSAEDFKQKAETLLSQLKGDELLVNLLNGVYLPVCFPRLKIADYGESFEEIFLPAVEKAYGEKYPSWDFENCRKGELAGKIAVIEGSRHQRLLDKMSVEPVVGIVFFPMRGYSVLAQRKQMYSLPSSILLCGAIDIATAIVAYPDVLARDWHTPGYACSAVSFGASAASLCFKAREDDLVFGDFVFLASASDRTSGGVVFLG